MLKIFWPNAESLFLRSHPAMVLEIRTRLCQTSQEETGRLSGTWHLDELFVRINGQQQDL